MSTCCVRLLFALMALCMLAAVPALAQTRPTLDVASRGEVTGTTAVLSGIIISGGDSAVTASGVVIGPTADPVLGGGGVVTMATDPLVTSGVFIVKATGLTVAQEYHFRAYATNSTGTTYTDDQTFTTAPIAITGVAINATGVWTSPAGGVWAGPARAPLGRGVRVRVHGAGFSAAGSWEVRLSKVGGGHADIVLMDLDRLDTRITSGTTESIWTTLAPLGDSAALGLWKVTVSNGMGLTAELDNAIEITAPTLTGATLTHNLPFGERDIPHVQAGTTVLLTAAPRGSVAPANVTYRFEARSTYESMPLMARDFGGGTFEWTAPGTAQAYWLTVQARAWDSTYGTQVVRSADLYIRVDEATLTGVGLSVTPSGNGAYRLTSTATGTAGSVHHRFVANVPVDGTGGAVPARYNAFTMRNYDVTPTYTWKPSSAVIGKTVKLTSYARLEGSSASLQRHSSMETLAVPDWSWVNTATFRWQGIDLNAAGTPNTWTDSGAGSPSFTWSNLNAGTGATATTLGGAPAAYFNGTDSGFSPMGSGSAPFMNIAPGEFMMFAVMDRDANKHGGILHLKTGSTTLYSSFCTNSVWIREPTSARTDNYPLVTFEAPAGACVLTYVVGAAASGVCPISVYANGNPLTLRTYSTKANYLGGIYTEGTAGQVMLTNTATLNGHATNGPWLGRGGAYNATSIFKGTIAEVVLLPTTGKSSQQVTDLRTSAESTLKAYYGVN